MPNPEDIDAQLELLRIYRNNLALFLRQQAWQGGAAHMTPGVANGIAQARTDIRRVKAILREWQVAIDDHPDDDDQDAVRYYGDTQESASGAPSPDLFMASVRPKAAPTEPFDPDGLEAYFTDVEHLRDAFKQLITAPAPPKRLLVIHGVGGAGKSSLLHMFRFYGLRTGVPVALASGDEVKSAADVIATWSDELFAQGIRLPTITKTLARYRGLQTTVERQTQKAASAAGKVAVKNAEGVVGSFAGAALGSVIPVFGTVAGAAVGALVGTSGEALVDWLGSFLKKPDIDLLLDPTASLTEALLADLAQAAGRQRLVLLLDTFEQLNALEDWARDLTQRLPLNLLLVLAGRAVPGWGRAWPSWMAQARVEELKPMTVKVMRELVCRYYAMVHGGEPDPAQVEAIVEFARGLPVVVTAAVQLWVSYGVEDFQSVKPQVVADLVDRLLEGVPRELGPMLEAAATLRWFNKDLLRAITVQEDVSTAYNELRKFPFIRPRIEGLALHDSVREMLDENLRISDRERHRELHLRAALYYEAQLRESAGSDTQKHWLERLYHRMRVDEVTGIQLFQEQIEELLRYHLFGRVRELLNDVSSYALERTQSKLWREYYTIQDLTLQNPEEAARRYRALSEHPDVETRLRAYALSEIGNIWRMTRFGVQPGALEQLARVTQESSALLPPEDSRRAMNLLNLGKGYYKAAHFAAANEQFLKTLDWYRERGERYGMARVFATLVKMYALQGDWHRMVEAQRQVLANLPDTLSPDSQVLKDVSNAGALGWCLAGHYFEVEQRTQQSLTARQRSGDLYLVGVLGELGFAVGLQGKYSAAAGHFQAAIENQRQVLNFEEAITFNLCAQILLKQRDWKGAEVYLLHNLETKRQRVHQIYWSDELYCLGLLEEMRGNQPKAGSFYGECLDLAWTERHFHYCGALVSLVRVKYAQDDHAAIPALFTEAEQLAQQYEYNDHLASLRLSQGHLAWEGHLPGVSSGFDAALAYYQQALIYALRYNRFLLDEVLWGGGVGTPLKPIIPHCLERTFEGQRMLQVLRDWWRVGMNDVGSPHPDTISPIPEGIPLLEAERIAREREPGDGLPQISVLTAIEQALTD